MDTKRCSKCEEIKPVTEFYVRKGSPDGYEYICKVCRRDGFKKNKRESLERAVTRSAAKPYKTKSYGKYWKITCSIVDKYGDELWPTNIFLTDLDVRETLRYGHFDAGMRILNTKTGIEYTIAHVNGRQVLQDSSNYFYMDRCKLMKEMVLEGE